MKSRRSSNQSGLMRGCALSLGNMAPGKPLVGPKKNKNHQKTTQKPDRTPAWARKECADTDACARIVVFACNSQPADLIFASMDILPAADCACASSARCGSLSLWARQRVQPGEDLRDWLHQFWCWAPEPLSGYKMCDIIVCAVGVPPPAARTTRRDLLDPCLGHKLWLVQAYQRGKASCCCFPKSLGARARKGQRAGSHSNTCVIGCPPRSVTATARMQCV